MLQPQIGMGVRQLMVAAMAALGQPVAARVRFELDPRFG